jgi:hypothetical protein
MIYRAVTVELLISTQVGAMVPGYTVSPGGGGRNFREQPLCHAANRAFVLPRRRAT